jgi:fructose-1-phosphate kinase PfkB-like protein
MFSIGGSLPRGLDATFSAPLIHRQKHDSIPTFLHPTEEDLESVLEEAPTVVKLDYQAHEWGAPEERLGTFMSRAQELHGRGTEWAMISLGRGKVAFSSRRGAWIAEAPDPEMVYVYATEDALLAGMIAAAQERASSGEIIRFAMACAWECATHPEKFPRDRTRVEELASRVLLNPL